MRDIPSTFDLPEWKALVNYPGHSVETPGHYALVVRLNFFCSKSTQHSFYQSLKQALT